MNVSNPYRFGFPVCEDVEFFGREALLRNARSMLGSWQPSGNLQIWGPKRMGKTSLLHRIRKEFLKAGSDILCVYLDSNSCEKPGRNGFAPSLCRALAVASKVEDDERSWESFNARLKSIAEKGPRVVLFLDEFQALVTKFQLDVREFGQLRAAAQLLENKLMLVIGTSRLLHSFGKQMMDSGLPFIFQSSEILPPLDKSAALAMIDRPARLAQLTLPEGAAEFLYECCGGHPYLTAICGHKLAELIYHKKTVEIPNPATFAALYGAVKDHLQHLGDRLGKYGESIRELALGKFQRPFETNGVPVEALRLVNSGLCVSVDNGANHIKLRPNGRLCATFLESIATAKPSATNEVRADVDARAVAGSLCNLPPCDLEVRFPDIAANLAGLLAGKRANGVKKHLACLYAFVRLGSQSLAADVLGYSSQASGGGSQRGVTYHLKELEKKLSCKLIEGGSVPTETVPTEIGKVIGAWVRLNPHLACLGGDLPNLTGFRYE